MAPRKSEERELQETLRAIAAMVLLFLFALIVLVTLFLPQQGETTLLLGLVASIMGAMPVLLGVQIALNRKENGEK